MNNLGKWALIDIETTGIDPSYDAIIDLGYLQFDGLTLVKEYTSLVRTDVPISKFIEKLTGINSTLVKNAPSWDKVEFDLLELGSHTLIAHNAAFEEKFLKKYFDNNPEEKRETFQDSLYLLGLLFPIKSSLSLETFIIDLGIAGKEEHRGLSDSRDLLKVMLVGARLLHLNLEFREFLNHELDSFTSDEFWFKNFLRLSVKELQIISEQINFDLEVVLNRYLSQNEDTRSEDNKDPTSLEFTSENIKKIFRDEERIKEKLPFYKYRKSQEDLALRVGASFTKNVHALIQAPTGTGKTLGYMIPSALFAMNSDEKILVATGTKALQNQALTKDVPALRKVLGITPADLPVSLLIGSSNHLCELKYRNTKDSDLMIQMRSFEEKFSHLFIETYFFLNSINPKLNLTRENIPYVLKRMLPTLSELEQEIKVDYRSCSGSLCPFKDSCTYMRGLKEAKDSKIIIGNHSLMLNWPRSFPRPLYVVVDEAHKIEGEATKAFSIEITQKELEVFSKNLMSQIGTFFYLVGETEEEPEKIISFVKNALSENLSILNDHLIPLKDVMEGYFKSLPRFTDLYWNESPMIPPSSTEIQSVSIRNHLESLKVIFENFASILAPYKKKYDLALFENNQSKIEAHTGFLSLVDNISDFAAGFSILLEVDDTYSRVIRYHENFGYLFESSPIDIGKIVHDNLLETSMSTIFTSATLANAKGSGGAQGVEWMTGYKYLDQAKRYKSGFFLDEVFDYKNKAKVFVATDTVSIFADNYVDSVLKEIIPLIRSLGGHTLLLFSSVARFNRATEILLEKLGNEIPLFIQGMGSQVVEEFKKTSKGVLVGKEAFGEGIDIPGDALQFVFIDKIPDLRREQVIDKRREFYEKSFGNEFKDYFMSHRARSLHQKLGRLLRTDTDFGAALVVDPRLSKWKGRTLNDFKELMEPYELQFTSLKESCESIESILVENKS